MRQLAATGGFSAAAVATETKPPPSRKEILAQASEAIRALGPERRLVTLPNVERTLWLFMRGKPVAGTTLDYVADSLEANGIDVGNRTIGRVMRKAGIPRSFVHDLICDCHENFAGSMSAKYAADALARAINVVK